MAEGATETKTKKFFDTRFFVTALAVVLTLVLAIFVYHTWINPMPATITAAQYATLSAADKAKYTLQTNGSYSLN